MATDKTAAPTYRVEELQRRTGTPLAAHCGACCAAGWMVGKQVTEAEYKAAVLRFLAAPMGGDGKC